MNVKLFIYIFSLFVILTPSFLFKTKESIFMNFIHALLFSLILYFTYNLVNYNKEPLDLTNMNIEVKGINNLNKLLRASLEEDDETTINIHNNFDNSYKGTIDYNFNAVNQCPPSLICSNPPTQCERIVLTAYNNMLGRHPGTLAFNFWVDECKKGLDIREIEDELAKTDEYKSLIGDSEREYTIQNPSFSSNPETKCGADFGLDVACCGQIGSIEAQFRCNQDQPICNNYKGGSDWGVCRSDGGFYGTNSAAISVGNNSSFTNARTTWERDGGVGENIGSWIWSQDVEKVASNSYVTFEYKHYNFDSSEENRKMVIATPESSNSEVIVFLLNTVIIGEGQFTRPPYSWVYKHSFGQGNVFIIEKPLNSGLNHFIIFVATKGDTLVPGGLLLCMKNNSQSSDESATVIFSSSSSFTTISRIPPVESDLMKSNNNFSPLIALYNRRSGAFLKGSADSRFYNNNNHMNITLHKSNVKKLPNDISVESMIFKLITNSNDSSRKFSLFNFAHQRFLGTENGTLSSTYMSEDQGNPVWDITYNKDFTISFSIIIWGQKKFLGVSKNENGEDIVSMLTLVEPDENCKWDTVQIETVMGKNGVTPLYSGYIGNYPVNKENRGENYLSEFEISDPPSSDDIKEFTVEKLGSNCSSDVNELLLCSINSKYINEVVPSYSLFCEANASELVIYDNMMVILDTTGKPYYRELYKKNKNLSSWWPFGGDTSPSTSTSTSTSANTNLSISKINGKMNVLYVNEEKLHFRDFDSFLRSDLNTVDGMNDVTMGIYNFIDENFYSLNNGNLYKNNNVITTGLKYIKLFYPNPNEYQLFGIDNNNKLVDIASNGNKDTLSNTEIKHFDIYNNIIFAVHINGYLMYKTICDTGSDFKRYIFKNTDPNNIEKVFIYSDVIYMVDGNNNIYSSIIQL